MVVNICHSLLYHLQLLRLGVNLKSFPGSGVPAIFAILFQLSIAAVLLLYVLFWLKVCPLCIHVTLLIDPIKHVSVRFFYVLMFIGLCRPEVIIVINKKHYLP